MGDWCVLHELHGQMQEEQIRQSQVYVAIAVQIGKQILSLLDLSHSSLAPLLPLEQIIIQVMQQLQRTINLRYVSVTELICRCSAMAKFDTSSFLG